MCVPLLLPLLPPLPLLFLRLSPLQLVLQYLPERMLVEVLGVVVVMVVVRRQHLGLENELLHFDSFE